ncbi:23S rRNA pseudouridine synthase [Citrifermentans bremense]|uniref:23S rRNA pseudouridine synthase n=1 Tax=Citrifermentans bremense TaxID=60035 RepID=A0A6S6M1Z2_9BACT|nr:RluA family pseudouridine synthase [Citrifermentans bremense]BCG48392.1 23S rRNA pseudouridine synthase [Citrifermentans bremense]
MLTYQIDAKDHGRRMDSFMRNLLPTAQFSYLKKLLSSGHVKVNGSPVEAAQLLKFADQVTLKESSKTAAFLARITPDLDILFEDSWIISLNKAPGLSVHRTEDPDEVNLVDLAETLLQKRDGVGRLRPVNRLDKGTSGAIILAKNAVAAGMFGKMIQEEGLGKLYLALVEGKLQKQGVIDAPLDGKESQTSYLRLFHGGGVSLLAVYPITGRMHQIRQHFRMIGHPILGDKRYGGRALTGFTGHALHSYKTTLVHPATGEEVNIPAPLPEQLMRLLSRYGAVSEKTLLDTLDQLPASGPLPA